MRTHVTVVSLIVCSLSLSCSSQFSAQDLRRAGSSYASMDHDERGLSLDPSYAGQWNMSYPYLPGASTTRAVGDIRGVVDSTSKIYVTSPVIGSTPKRLIFNAPFTFQMSDTGDAERNFPQVLEFTNLPYTPLVYVKQAMSEMLPLLDKNLTPARLVSLVQASQPQLFTLQTNVSPPLANDALDPVVNALWGSIGAAWAYLPNGDPAYGAGGGNYAVSAACIGCHASQMAVSPDGGQTVVPFLQLGTRQMFASGDPVGYTRPQLQSALAAWLEQPCVIGAQTFISAPQAQQEYCAAKAVAHEVYQSALDYANSQQMTIDLYQGDANTVVGLMGYVVAMLNMSTVWRDVSQADSTASVNNFAPVKTAAFRSGGVYADFLATMTQKWAPGGQLQVPENRGRRWAGFFDAGNPNGFVHSNSFKYNYLSFWDTTQGQMQGFSFQADYLAAATRSIIPMMSEFLFTNPEDYGFSSLASVTAALYDRRIKGSDVLASSGSTASPGSMFFSSLDQGITPAPMVLKSIGQPVVAGQALAGASTSFTTYCAGCHGSLMNMTTSTPAGAIIPLLAEAVPSAPVESGNQFVTDFMSGMASLRGLPASVRIIGESTENVVSGSYMTDSGRDGGLRATDSKLRTFMADGEDCVSSLKDLALNPPGKRAGGYNWPDFSAPWSSGGPLPGVTPAMYASWSPAPNPNNDALYGAAVYEANQVHPQFTEPSDSDAANICLLLAVSTVGSTLSDGSAGVVFLQPNYTRDQIPAGPGGTTPAPPSMPPPASPPSSPMPSMPSGGTCSVGCGPNAITISPQCPTHPTTCGTYTSGAYCPSSGTMLGQNIGC